MDKSNRQQHDWLLAHKPEGAVHDMEACAFCSTEGPGQEEEVTEPLESEQKMIFTQEQHEQLLASAVEKALATSTTASDKEILRLNEQLESTEKALADAEAEVAALQAAAAEREEHDRLVAVAEDRAKLVTAVAKFSDEQVQARKLDWAKMEDEAFASYLNDIKEVATAAAAEDSDDEEIKTEFDGTRDSGAEGTEVSALERLFGSEHAVPVI